MIEPDEVKRFQRHVAAMIKAAGDDPEAFATIATIIEDAKAGLSQATAALQSQGFSWANIGAALGITRTAAHKRYARPGA